MIILKYFKSVILYFNKTLPVYKRKWAHIPFIFVTVVLVFIYSTGALAHDRHDGKCIIAKQ